MDPLYGEGEGGSIRRHANNIAEKRRRVDETSPALFMLDIRTIHIGVNGTR
jgi:hypothetical protein